MRHLCVAIPTHPPKKKKTTMLSVVETAQHSTACHVRSVGPGTSHLNAAKREPTYESCGICMAAPRSAHTGASELPTCLTYIKCRCTHEGERLPRVYFYVGFPCFISFPSPVTKPPNLLKSAGLRFSGSSGPVCKAIGKLSIDCASVNRELLGGN